MILTDGYFDFEDKNHGIHTQNQSTTTAQLLGKMNVPNWMQKASELQLGIMPVKLQIPARWLVCGIQSKANCKDLLESEKLSYLWELWLKQSGGTTIQKPVMNSSSNKVKSLIQNNL